LKRSLFIQVPAFILVRVVLNTMIRMVYPFMPVLGRGLGVELRQLSWAFTLRSLSGVLGPLLASIGDSRGRKTGMIAGLLLFILGTGLMAVWPSYPTFVLTLILTLAGNLTFIPSMQAYLGDRVPYRRRGLVLGLTELGWSLAFIVGVPLVGLLIARRGWLAPFPFLSLLGCVSLILLSILLPKDNRKESGSQPGVWQNLRQVLTYPPALAGIALGFLISGSNELVNLIFGVWLEDTFQVKVAALATASAVIGFSELGAEVLVTAFTDWLGKRRAVAIGLALNGLAALALPGLGRNLSGALVGLFLLYLTFEFTLVSSIPMMTEVMPSARATLMATFIAGTATGRALGAFLAPPLYELGQIPGAPPGLLAIALVAVSLNLGALFTLRIIRIAKVTPALEVQ
jgi:predicted MFS family arabinose efflux permease